MANLGRFRLLMLTGVISCLHSFSFLRHFQGGGQRSRFSSSKLRTEVRMTLDSTPWSHTDSEQSLTWLEDGNRIEYLDSSRGSKTFSSLADAIGLNISSDFSERSIIPHHLTSAQQHQPWAIAGHPVHHVVSWAHAHFPSEAPPPSTRGAPSCPRISQHAFHTVWAASDAFALCTAAHECATRYPLTPA